MSFLVVLHHNFTILPLLMVFRQLLHCFSFCWRSAVLMSPGLLAAVLPRTCVNIIIQAFNACNISFNERNVYLTVLDTSVFLTGLLIDVSHWLKVMAILYSWQQSVPLACAHTMLLSRSTKPAQMSVGFAVQVTLAVSYLYLWVRSCTFAERQCKACNLWQKTSCSFWMEPELKPNQRGGAMLPRADSQKSLCGTHTLDAFC